MQSKTLRMYVFPIILFVAVGLLWYTSWNSIPKFFYKETVATGQPDGKAPKEEHPTLSERGLMGDAFGAVNALFSALTVAGVVIALVWQHHEIQENEVSHKQQMQLLQLQQFDAHFFQLFEAWQRSIKLKDIRSFAGDLQEVLVSNLPKSGTDREHVKKMFKAIYPNYFVHCHTYLAILQQILLYINESTLSTAAERERYNHIIIAHLSQKELEVLAYVGATEDEWFKVIKESDALRYMNIEYPYLGALRLMYRK